jgi:Flp pilus assembly protein TadG
MTTLAAAIRSLRRLAFAPDGNVTIIFALALIPIIGFIGAAVDYTRASATRSALQASLDSVALMLSKEAPSLTTEQITKKANDYFLALFDRPEAKSIVLTPILTQPQAGSYNLRISATAAVGTTFLDAFGKLIQTDLSKINIGTSTEAEWGIKRLELALALDNTGSMSSNNKMTELKNATKSLLNTLYGAAKKTDDIKVAIVPFATDVNVDKSKFQNATWIDWSDWEAEPVFTKPGNWDSIGPGSNCPFSNSTHGFRCTTGPTNGSSNTNTIPSSGTYSGYICPSIDNGSKYSTKKNRYYNGCYNSVPTTTTSTNTVCSGWSCSCGSLSNCSCTGSGGSKVCTQTVTTTGAPYTHNWIKNARDTWNGCVWDREQPYDANDTSPGGTSTQFQSHQVNSCATSMTGLVDILANWKPADLTSSSPTSTLGQKVNAMTPTGNTNVTIGLAWAWHVLTSTEPLTDASTPKPDLDKVIILLTDGDNTQNRFSNSGSEIDQRTQTACANVKAANIKLYTIRVIDGNSTLLKNCATNASMYYDVQNASQLNAVFSSIAQNLANLRIAK